jgi:hypothetical protein
MPVSGECLASRHHKKFCSVMKPWTPSTYIYVLGHCSFQV